VNTVLQQLGFCEWKESGRRVVIRCRCDDETPWQQIGRAIDGILGDTVDDLAQVQDFRRGDDLCP
jgi:hypothetical protein